MEPEAVGAAQSQPGAIEIREAAAFLCRERARCKVLHGGRGGLKSWSAARTLLLAGVDRTLRILCAREFQNSIADSRGGYLARPSRTSLITRPSGSQHADRRA